MKIFSANFPFAVDNKGVTQSGNIKWLTLYLSNGRMINARTIGKDLKVNVRDGIDVRSQNLPGGTKKFPQIFSQSSRCSERDLNRVPAKYESRDFPLLIFK
jgi:hypothetical protein